MLQDVIPSQEQLSIDEITSPLGAQIFEFCDPELFQETFQTSEVNSGSNHCCYDENSSYANNNNSLSLAVDPEKSGSFQDNSGSNTNTTTTTTTTTSTGATENNNVNDDNNNNNNNGDVTIIFDTQDDFDNDISASIDFSSSLQFPVSDHFLGATNQDQFDFSAIQVQQPPNILYSSSGDPLALSAVSMVPQLQSAVFEEDCLSSVPSYNVGLNPSSPSCSFLGTAGLPAYVAVPGNINPGLSAASSGFFSGSILLGSELHPHDQLMDYQADNGRIFCQDSIQRVFNRGDLQALSGGENQTHLVAAVAAPPPPPPLGAEMTGLEDPTFNKVGKLSVEQRKEKIHRYMKKRNERNFSKKIKYACRKTLADSRPRVRGRFAKNDEFGEANRQASSGHHDDDDDDDVGVKEEEEMVDSSDIFSHISGVNSFKCNYPIQSWI